MNLQNLEHKCNTCIKTYPGCNCTNPLFAEDRIIQPHFIHGDTILWCGEYEKNDSKEVPSLIVTGGPAFPVQIGPECFENGMTLRDWFAGKALAGMMFSVDMDQAWPDPKIIAELAYGYADAMLKARVK